MASSCPHFMSPHPLSPPSPPPKPHPPKNHPLPLPPPNPLSSCKISNPIHFFPFPTAPHSHSFQLLASPNFPSKCKSSASFPSSTSTPPPLTSSPSPPTKQRHVHSPAPQIASFAVHLLTSSHSPDLAFHLAVDLLTLLFPASRLPLRCKSNAAALAVISFSHDAE